MEKKEDRRVTMTKRMLKESLTEILKEKDIYHISVRELCERADVNRTTFYKYYGSQFDLLADMENDLISFITEMLKNGDGNLESIIISACKYLEENIDFARLIINNNVDSDFPKRIFSIDAVKSSAFRNMTGDDARVPFEYAYNYCTSGAFSVFCRWINKERREPPEELAEIISALLSRR